MYGFRFASYTIHNKLIKKDEKYKKAYKIDFFNEREKWKKGKNAIFLFIREN